MSTVQEEKGVYTQSTFNPEVDALIAKMGRQRHLKKNEVFLIPGQLVSSLFYVHSGRTNHYMLDEQGSQKLLYSLSSGWFFGETPLFMETETNLLSLAITPTLLTEIPYKECNYLLGESELFRNALIHSLCSKLLTARYEIAQQAFSSCQDRILTLLWSMVSNCKETNREWVRLNNKITQAEIGEIVGVNRVTANRQINSLVHESYIRMNNGYMEINIPKICAKLNK